MKKLLILFLFIASVCHGQVELPFGILNKNAGGADTKYGPYANLAAAKTGVPLALRYDGCTVKIIGDGEYNWLQSDLSDAGLVRKTAFFSLATSSAAGIAKLYTSPGNSTDGAMDRNSTTAAISTAISTKWPLSGIASVGDVSIQDTDNTHSVIIGAGDDPLNNPVGYFQVIASGASGNNTGNIDLVTQSGGSMNFLSNYSVNITSVAGQLNFSGNSGTEFGDATAIVFDSPVCEMHSVAAAGESAIILSDGSGVLSSSLAVPNGTTGTTQSISDASTKIATTAFTQNLMVADHIFTGVQQFKSPTITTPSVIFANGPGPTSPVNGWMWYDNTHLYFRTGSTSVDLLAAGTGVTSVTASSPLTGGVITTTGSIGISDAVANGSGKGAATFEAADFNSSAGDISIDYTNAQKATTSVPGFLSATDWTAFNGKQSALVSGTNIKTINSTSILGSGDISVATITNGAANTEMMQSDGTNAVSSKIFSPSLGNLTLGDGSISGTARTISVSSSTAGASLVLSPMAGGGVYIGGSGLGLQLNSGNLFLPSSEIYIGATGTGKIHSYDQSGPGQTGYDLQITAGKGGSGNSSGGNLVFAGGAKQGSGTPGYIQFSQLTGSVPGVLALDATGISSYSSMYNLDLNSATTSGSTITLDLNSQIQRMFVGASTFATAKTMAITNSTNIRVFDFHFEITNLAATLTLPTGWLMSDINFASHVWTPPSTGKYELTGTFDGNFWKIKIAGPFL